MKKVFAFGQLVTKGCGLSSHKFLDFLACLIIVIRHAQKSKKKSKKNIYIFRIRDEYTIVNLSYFPQLFELLRIVFVLRMTRMGIRATISLQVVVHIPRSGGPEFDTNFPSLFSI